MSSWNRWDKRLKRRISTIYWMQWVRRTNIKRYLHHEIDLDRDGEDYTSREDLACIETNEYLKRAEQVHVTLSDVPLPEGVKSHWKHAYHGDSYLVYPTLIHFKKAVEEAEYKRRKRNREGRELVVKYFTALAATVAALASIYTALFKK